MKNNYKNIILTLLIVITLLIPTSIILADSCPNIPGDQSAVPSGFELNSEGNCVFAGSSNVGNEGTSSYNPGSTGTGTVDFHVVKPGEPLRKSSDQKYELLAPFSEQFRVFNTDKKCAFGEYANIMITIFLGVCAVLAMIMIIMGGIEYMTSELISSKEAGKEKILHAVLGLLLALGAWLILNTINPNILNLCLDKVTPIKIYFEDEDTPHAPIDGKYCMNPSYDAKTMIDNKLVDTPWDNKISTTIPELPATAQTSSSGGNGECRTVGEAGCTSIRGLDPFIIKKIYFYCSTCQITITGGTECWLHSRATSHKPGSATVDLRFSDTLDKYIESGKFIKNNGKGEPIYSTNGVTYVKESDHWHAQKQ